MKNCTYRLSLGELLSRPAVELRLVGADGEGENGSEAGSTNDSGNGSDNGSGGDDNDDKGDKGKAQRDPKDVKIAALEEEKQRHYDLRLEAEAELKKARKKIEELENNGTTDADTKQKLVDLGRENENLKVTVGDLRLENAFLKSNKYQWVRPAAALRLADLSKVRIDDKTGDVFGLDEALKALAEDSPFLLVQDAGDDKDDEKDKDGDKKKRRTGTPPGDKGTQDDKSKQATEAKLRSKYAGLRR